MIDATVQEPIIPEVNIPVVEKTEEEEKQEVVEKTYSGEEDVKVTPEEPVKEENKGTDYNQEDEE